MEALEELLAREQIRQLAQRYGVCVDAKDLEGLAQLFADDVDNGKWGHGRHAVQTYYDHVLRGFHCSMHMVGNHVIDFDDDDHAHGIVYCRAHHHVLAPEHWFDVSLAYWDIYEHDGVQWCFRRRRLKSWYRQEFGHPSHGAGRVLATGESEGPKRGVPMPEAFPTFAEFWSRDPRQVPPS